MKTVLVTGSRGFTGKYVVKALQKKGYNVIGLVRNNPQDHEAVIDITNLESVRQVVRQYEPDGVIHLAALSFVAHEDQSAFYNVNVFGALNLFEAMEAEGVKPDKVVIASSANIYGNPMVGVITEETPPEPINHYAASKLAMEYMVKNWFSCFPVIITRPFNYTGVGQDSNFLVPKIVSHYRNRKKIIELGNLDVARDFSDVRDIAQAYVVLYESGVSSEIINLSSGRVYELGDIINMMNAIAGYSINVETNVDFVRKNEIKVLRGSNDKLRRLTGFALEIPLLETLKVMYSA